MGACERRRRGCGILLGIFASRRPPSSTRPARRSSASRRSPKVPTATSTMGRQRSERARCSCRRTSCNTTTPTTASSRSATSRSTTSGSTLEADRVIYDQTTKRMRAEGNARLTEADGKVIHGEIIDLSDDFRDGFVDSLQLEAADKTRIAAPRADRTERHTSPCSRAASTPPASPARTIRSKPPLWQVKATRIIHDDSREDDLFRGRAPRILRHAARLLAVLLRARPDGEAQDRLADADVLVHQHSTASASRCRTTGRWRRTTTSRSRRCSRPSRACCCRANGASG